MVAGCFAARGDSCDAETSGISMLAEVLDDGDTVRAEANFEFGDRSGPGTVLELCDDDVLTINGQEPTVTSKYDEVEYSVTWNDPADAPTDFVFRLERREQEETVMAEIELPGRFELIIPQPEQEISRGAEFTLEWTPAGDQTEMTIAVRDEIGIDCVGTAAGEHHYAGPDGVQVPDTGLRLLPAFTLAGGTGGTPPTPALDLDPRCVATFAFQRAITGEYPDALERGGAVRAAVRRTVETYAVP